MDSSLDYEEIPYPAYVHPQTHPAHIAAISRACGVNTPPVDTARVLELGCGPGTNLLAMAELLPRAEFVGLDLAANHIDMARTSATTLGLANIHFYQQNLLENTSHLGTFDYVIAHGLYSWVPPSVQARVLEVCSSQLRPGGVAFVSYNCLPGWHLRRVMFDLLRMPREGTPAERLEKGRQLVNILAQGPRSRSPAWGHLMREERRFLKESEDSYLLHEYLVDRMEPLYFKTFMERAQANGLEFLSEADELGWMLPGTIPELIDLGIDPEGDLVETQQMVDFFVGRTFRQTLLVPRGTPKHLPFPRGLAGQYVAARLKIHDEDLSRSRGPLRFRTQRGDAMVEPRDEMAKVLKELAKRWPEMVPVDNLVALAEEGLDDPETGRNVRATLYMGWVEGWVELKSWCPPLGATAPDRPRICPSVLLNLPHGGAANLRHEWVDLDGDRAKLLPLLDGTRTRSELRVLVGLTELQVDEAIKWLHRASFFLQ